MHRDNFPFSENEKWQDLVNKRKPCWTTYAKLSLSSELLDHVYKRTMTKVLEILKNVKRDTTSIGGATNVLYKSISNCILNAQILVFVEYLCSDLKRETTINVVANVKETVN